MHPNSAHKYLTPKEVLDDKRVEPGKFKEQFTEARISRNITHSNPECGVCLPISKVDE